MRSVAEPTALHLIEPAHTMRGRVPAQSLIEQVLRIQESARPRTRAERFFGRGPLDPDAHSWFSGADGERTVAALLAGLPEDWTVLHSLPVGRSGADIDHLVVGPAGVFTVNTKHHVDASVWVAGRSVVVAGRKQPYVARAEAEAARVDRLLSDVVPECAGGTCPEVRSIVAVVGARRLTVRDAPRSVDVVRAESLRRFLLRQPVRLGPDDVQRLVAVLERPSAWQPAAEADAELLLRFGALEREVRRARRIRTSWAMFAAAVPVVAVVGAVTAAAPYLRG
jgi:hypothetical protein